MEDLPKKEVIKQWISHRLLENSSHIMLSEVISDKDSTDKKTLVMILKDRDDGYAKFFQLDKCISQLTEMDISQSLEFKDFFERENLNQSCAEILRKTFAG